MKFEATPKSLLTLIVLIVLAAVPTAALASSLIGSHSLNHSTSTSPIRAPQNPATPNDLVGFDCATGASQAVLNATSFPVADGETGTTNVGQLTVDPKCTWVGDLGAFAGVPDGTTEPLVADQDESFSTVSAEIGGGFTANIVLIQNATSVVDGFDLTFSYDPSVVRAVTIDQGGLAPWGTNSFTAVASIDNVAGQVHMTQVIFGSPLPGNFTLFRVRFDVVGVGSTALTWVPGAVSIQNPSNVAVTTFNGAFDSESFFDPGHTLGWKATFSSSPVPAVPGSPLTFTATGTCSGCTGNLKYAWSFAGTSPAQATTNPATITAPTPMLLVNRVNLTITDSATPTPHSISLAQRLPLAANQATSTTLSVGTSGSIAGSWLGGLPPYTGSWRFCPGTLTQTTICSKPNPAIASTSSQTTTQTVTYNFAGIYNDSISITDTAPPPVVDAFHPSNCIGCTTAPVTLKHYFGLNVTNGPQAFSVALSTSRPAGAIGSPVNFTATVAYGANYPTAFQAGAFTYTYLFGDGTSLTEPGSRTSTAQHTYATLGAFTVQVVVMENDIRAVSQIRETQTMSFAVNTPITGDFTFTPNSATTGQSVSFSAAASGGMQPYTYGWDFGDGTTGTGMSVTHTYSAAGSHTVILTIKDSASTTITSTHVVVIGSEGSSPLVYVGIAAVVAVALATAILFFRRRRKGIQIAG
jgi:hypothetical protein